MILVFLKFNLSIKVKINMEKPLKMCLPLSQQDFLTLLGNPLMPNFGFSVSIFIKGSIIKRTWKKTRSYADQ